MAKTKKETLVLSITRNQKDEFQIIRDGGMLQSFLPTLMDSQMILQYTISLGRILRKSEKRPVRVVDNFSTTTPTCPDCGSTHVSTKAWQNFKTGSIDTISAEEDDNYCNECEKHVELFDIEINPKVGIEILSIK